jgi:hypothetical protein
MKPGRLNEKPALYIFHIRRAGARPAFLHPLKPDKNFIPVTEDSHILGRYGSEPRIESVTLLRNDLYRMCETAVREWVFELRFIPRFLICAGVFLVAYFFASVVIRDPLPMIDEIVIGLGAATVSWFLIGRRFLSSRAAEEKRNDLHTVIDGIAFNESDFIKKIEEILDGLDGATGARLVKIYNAACSGRQESTSADSGEDEPLGRLSLSPQWEEEARALDKCLEASFSGKSTRDFGRRLGKKMKLYPELNKTLEALRKLISATRMDFPLFVLHILLRRARRNG